MLSVLALRGQLGSLVRSAAAVLFPSTVALADREPELGILLYLFETVLPVLGTALRAEHRQPRGLAARRWWSR